MVSVTDPIIAYALCVNYVVSCLSGNFVPIKQNFVPIKRNFVPNKRNLSRLTEIFSINLKGNDSVPGDLSQLSGVDCIYSFGISIYFRNNDESSSLTYVDVIIVYVKG